MHLVRLGRSVWEVLAVADSRRDCVLDDLIDLCRVPTAPGAPGVVLTEADPGLDPEQRLAYWMIAHLQEDVPANGPGKMPTSRYLTNQILEFRRGPKRGKKLRVNYFYGAGHKVVVCVSSFFKREETPKREIKRADKMRRKYFEDEENGLNIIEEF